MKNRFKTGAKRIGAFLTAICCFCSLFLFSSCTVLEKPHAITINGVGISDDVFIYFLDCAVNESDKKAQHETIIDRASKLTETYFKTNSMANTYKISLTTAEKAEVSEKVNAYWDIYGGYYTDIGVTKETLTKVFTADSYRDALLVHHYGEGGVEEIPVSRLYANFKTNYIVFQAITGYFTETDTNGNTVRIDKTALETLVLKFQNMSEMVNAGEQTMEEAAEFLSESGYNSSVQTVVLHKDDNLYPVGFFEKVQEIDSRKASVIGTNDYIFLVLRGEPDVNSTYFTDRKTDILKELVGTGIDETIEASYNLEVSLTDSSVNTYLSLIQQKKGA